LVVALLCTALPAAARAQDPVTQSAPTDTATVAAPVAPTTVTPPLPTTFWIATAAAGVGLLTGITFGFLALDAQTDFDKQPNESDASRGETLAVFADVGFGVALLGAITAVVLYGIQEDEAAEGTKNAAPPKSTVTLTPQLGTNGGGATLRVTF